MGAIFSVQQNASPIKKSATGQVGSRQYKYNNMNDTWDTIKGLMKDNNLVVYQAPTNEINGSYSFKTTLYHVPSAQFITEVMPFIITKQDPQGIGSAITYYRRYMIVSMLGLIPDDDNDAREQRLATAQQKLKIVGAVKQSLGITEPGKINSALLDIIGKHPSKILEGEADNVIELVKAYKIDGEQ